MKIIYIDGSFLSEEEAKISIFDRGFLFGDGIYVTIQVKDGLPVFLSSHLDHLQQAALSFQIAIPNIPPSIIFDLITHNRANQGLWRLRIIVTGGTSSLNTLPNRHGSLVLYMEPFHPAPFLPLKVALFSTPFTLCHASFKSLAHLNRYYVMDEAKRRGFDDCLTRTEKKGVLLEASFGNIFWISNGCFYTPSDHLPLYSGITIGKMQQIAEKLGFQINKGEFTFEEIPKDSICFRTNTMSGLRPICQIENQIFIQNKEIESSFLQAYEELIEKDRAHLSQECISA